MIETIIAIGLLGLGGLILIDQKNKQKKLKKVRVSSSSKN